MKKEMEVLVIGAGPAGLAATYTLAKNKVPVTCFEADTVVGGISRTVEYQGFRFDIGGHRFFSKIQSVNDLWYEILGDDFLTRPRLSRIFYQGKFFHYPLQPMNALFGLGIFNSLRILFSFFKAKIFPLQKEQTFEQWVTNRFGSVLYNIFFKTYTEKLWGIPCTEIQAEWAAQRIKGLSLWSAVANALFKRNTGIKTLINEFHYPRLGPGQMYETMADKAESIGAGVKLQHRVASIKHDGRSVRELIVSGPKGEESRTGSDFISTMPITELILRMEPAPPAEVIAAAKALKYRSLLTINLLLNRPEALPDTWIYVHDSSVKMGRIQCFANWSPFMVPDKQHSSLGLEYFCWEGDALWATADEDLLKLGIEEAAKLGLLDPKVVMDGFVVRMPKCYPVYDENYREHIETIKNYLTAFNNLQLCGRYGLFKYNNMDHSILTAQYAVENILGANHDVWAVNADEEYHEEEKK